MLKGEEINLSRIEGFYLDPIISVKRGQKTRVIFKTTWPVKVLSTGMGMMHLPLTAHIHGLQFQITVRDISWLDAAVWKSVKDGSIDQGWQDIFLLMPGIK